VRRIADVGTRHDKSVGTFVARTAEAGRFRDLGISIFACNAHSHLAVASRDMKRASAPFETADQLRRKNDKYLDLRRSGE
jgi:2-keto-3-deoxy-L-rhamnonate aldolase RhmA